MRRLPLVLPATLVAALLPAGARADAGACARFSIDGCAARAAPSADSCEPYGHAYAIDLAIYFPPAPAPAGDPREPVRASFDAPCTAIVPVLITGTSAPSRWVRPADARHGAGPAARRPRYPWR